MLFSIAPVLPDGDRAVPRDSIVATSRRGPLAGMRVIDLSRLAPGPYATRLPADDIATRTQPSERKTGRDWPPPYTSHSKNKIAGGKHERRSGHV